MTKVRADQLLVDRGLAESRARAQALILAGLVYSGERKIGKAGEGLAADAPLDVRGKDHPWVSRGGIKLAHGLDRFGWDVAGALAPLGARATVLSELPALVQAIASEVRPGDHVLVMSNGGFGGIHEKLLSRISS